MDKDKPHKIPSDLRGKIRNFALIAHIDHGKSTLADRFLEITGTLPKEKIKEQTLDRMDLERERGITIKLTPARMHWRTRINADFNADQRGLLYEGLTYKIRGAFFNVYNSLGPGHKENIYQKALEEEFEKLGLDFETEKTINVIYEDKKIGIYKPDFVIDDKIIIEIKALTFIGSLEKKQTWHYLKGSKYKLALLVNFGGKELQIERVIYDKARENLSAKIRVPIRENPQDSKQDFVLNLIDTPGHVDFTYEVSRSLAAVEGAILLVDATQGIQAQTLTNLHLAQEQGLVIIPVINKIDLPGAEIERVSQEIENLLEIGKDEIILASAKEGTGIEKILDKVVSKVPAPTCQGPEPWQENEGTKALIFDSTFDNYKGVVAFVRLKSGAINKGGKITFMATGKTAEALEVGYLNPDYVPTSKLEEGEIGYIVTGLKQVSEAKVGDTITTEDPNDKAQMSNIKPLTGYKEIKPFVYASLYSTTGEPHELRESLEKLKLNDASLTFEPENSPALGSGFRVGFLGLLHLDIIRERLEREFKQDLIITTPSVSYKVVKEGGPSTSLGVNKEQIIKGANEMPEPGTFLEIQEPMVKLEIITPVKYLGPVMELSQKRRGEYKNTDYLDTSTSLSTSSQTALVFYEIPLSEIIVDFYDELKSISSGYASLNYEFTSYRKADLVKMDILVAGDVIPPLSLIVPREKAGNIGRNIVKKLKETIPRQLFSVSLQAAIGGKILAREDVPPLRKDVTAKLYGGDVTRKRKLLEKQKKGKKRLKRFGKVDIPQEAFLSILRR